MNKSGDTTEPSYSWNCDLFAQTGIELQWRKAFEEALCARPCRMLVLCPVRQEARNFLCIRICGIRLESQKVFVMKSGGRWCM